MSRTFAANFAPSRVRRVVQQVAVILEHRAAAGGVDDDRVDVRVELRPNAAQFGRGELPGPAPPGRRDSAARRSRPGARHPHLAAVLLQHLGGRHGRLREEGVGGAADEQGDARPPRPLGRQHLRQLAVVRLQRRQHLLHLPQRPRQQLEQADASASGRRARATAAAAAAPAPSASAGVGRQVEQHQPLQPARASCRSAAVFAMCMRNGSISLPYCTPEGQADSQARHPGTGRGGCAPRRRARAGRR